MTRSKKATKRTVPPVIDPYLPETGNFGYRVSRYELDLKYKVAINRLSGTATITAATLASLRTFTLDLSDALTVTKVSVNGRRPAQFRSSDDKLHIALQEALPAGAAMTIAVRYGGTPRPVHSYWGEVGFEGCPTVCSSRVNRTAPHRGFPATTIPAPRPASAFRSAPSPRTTHWPTVSCCHAVHARA